MKYEAGEPATQGRQRYACVNAGPGRACPVKKYSVPVKAKTAIGTCPINAPPRTYANQDEMLNRRYTRNNGIPKMAATSSAVNPNTTNIETIDDMYSPAPLSVSLKPEKELHTKMHNGVASGAIRNALIGRLLFGSVLAGANVCPSNALHGLLQVAGILFRKLQERTG